MYITLDDIIRSTVCIMHGRQKKGIRSFFLAELRLRELGLK
jgi:hypothetical protein